MTRRLFGTDGIRGLANQAPMTPETAFRIGLAVTWLARRRVAHPPRVLVGKDTRLSGYMLETALAAGVCAQGGRVLLTGPLPTPAIAHLTTSMRADAGIVISASHNPFEDNGIKIFGPDGFKLPDADEAAIEGLLASSELDRDRPTHRHVGRAERVDDAPGRYIAFVKATFPAARTLDGMRIVVDAAHGAAYRVAPLVFSELGAEVHAIGVEPDGLNINRRSGALHPEACAREVLRRRAHLGVALDGDADRVVVIDETGRQVDGDAVMALCALRMLRQGRLAHRTLVATVMTNLGVERAMQRAGGRLVRTAVGDRYVVEAMRAGGYNFGGEQSGHMIFLDHATTGDGLVAALQLLAIVLEEGRPLSALAREAFEPVPQVLLNVPLPVRRPLEEMTRTRRAVERAERVLGASGRVLVRWSGTEPKLRIMLEGPRRDRIEALARAIERQAREELDTSRASSPPRSRAMVARTASRSARLEAPQRASGRRSTT
ncbi:MAG: phosphoglucosamine mutase [Myxococcota bacterium]|nr:phosphoglucosamine mutase [Myxococcota bacterium]MDW8362232.1 phosphoglucosamine mutase [Myxococcales bacterium]